MPRCQVCEQEALPGSARCEAHTVATVLGTAELATAVTAVAAPPVLAAPPPPAAASLPVELEAGMPVGEYVVECVVGRGGMGVVYRAVHPVIGKTVAIKVLAPAFAADPEAHARFVQEARAVNQIRHKHLIDIFGFGQLADGRQYYVMEYLDGRSLTAWIEAAGRLTAELALPIFADLLRALAAVHQHGIVHRDLKPDNVILLPDEGGGRPSIKILDFGVAKLLADGGEVEFHRTRTGTPVGTPLYMSPEQCLGKKIDARADLYALGIMLFEALTGRLPFLADTYFEMLQLHLTKPPPVPSEIAPDAGITPEMDAFIARLLEKDPEHRFAGAGDALAALEAVAATMGLSLHPRSVTGEMPRLPGSTSIGGHFGVARHRRRVGPAVALAVLVAGAGGGALLFASRHEAVAPPPPPDAAALAPPPPDAAPPPVDAAPSPPDAAGAGEASAPRPRPRKATPAPPERPKPAKRKPGDDQFLQPAVRPKFEIPK